MFDADNGWHILAKFSWLNVNTQEDARAVLQHFFTGYGIILTSVILSYLSGWSWIKWVVAIGWFCLSVYQEAFPDGHLDAILDHRWVEEMWKDFRADIITKLAGELALIWSIWMR